MSSERTLDDEDGWISGKAMFEPQKANGFELTLSA
jgi:hypothetical protein